MMSPGTHLVKIISPSPEPCNEFQLKEKKNESEIENAWDFT